MGWILKLHKLLLWHEKKRWRHEAAHHVHGRARSPEWRCESQLCWFLEKISLHNSF